jgi:A/G-specific adenine glycosylase
MPWRSVVTPYRTLVSELMLQQTRVETVIPYFERFMKEFPTVEDLARAPEQRVLELWAGLGYYSRARNLQKAAVAVVDAGGFPRDLQALQALPGVGPYTAGAVASIALGLHAAVVDGNVERVMARVFALTLSATALRKRVWEEATRAVTATVQHEPGSAGDFNQALMELGATVCTPRSPLCSRCPIAAGCAGKENAAAFPVKAAKKVSPVVRATALVRVVDGRIWLGKRPDGLLGGLWEPPISAEWSLSEETRSIAEVVHVFSHRRLLVDVRVPDAPAVDLAAETSPMPSPVLTEGAYAEQAWVSLGELEFRALSTLAWKVIRAGVMLPARRRPAR